MDRNRLLRPNHRRKYKMEVFRMDNQSKDMDYPRYR
jgi:hypothetical protein